MFKQIFLLLLFLFISGCTKQPQLSSSNNYTGEPYSLASIDYAYQQKVHHD